VGKQLPQNGMDNMNDQPPTSAALDDAEALIRTDTLPEGALFVSPEGVLYQVVMAGEAGFRKAEPWPWLPHGWSGDTERPNAVALVPGSLLARNYPLVSQGRPLPTVNRSELLDANDQPEQYIFPTEQLAKLASQLDETLAHRSGLGARKVNHRWILSDGKQPFRVYHYQRDNLDLSVDLEARFAEEQTQARWCTQGPPYWRYIPAWQSALDALSRTADTPEPMLETEAAEAAKTTQELAASEPPPSLAERELSPQSTMEIPSSEIEPQEHPVLATPAVSQTRRSPAMILSIDIGYGYTKGAGPDDLRFSFPSVIGTAEEISFATDLIRGGEERPIKYGDWRFFYGDQAVLQSRIQSAIFDRSRVHDHTYKMLFVATLVELSKVMPDIHRLNVVTGLPVDFFGDRPQVVQSFEGTYRITADHTMEFIVDSVIVVPQPFGSLFRELLSENGKISNSEIERGQIGIIDVGTFTTDFIVSYELRYIQRLSGSARVGWSTVVNRIQQVLDDQYMLELGPHEVDTAVQTKEVRVRGESVSLQSLIAPAITDLETAIIARARDLWGSGTHLDRILVTGGGGPHLYDAIRAAYPHAVLLENAFWANVEGFYRFGQRPASFEK